VADLTIRDQPDPAVAAERALAFLGQQEAVNNLMIAILLEALRDAGSMAQLSLTLVERDETIVAVALQNAIQYLLSPAADPAAVAALAAHAARRLPEAPSWLGPSREAALFAEAWQRLRGRQGAVRTRLRIYQADRIQPVPGVPGTLRPAREEDRTLLASWRFAFARVTGSESTPKQAARVVDRHIAAQSLYVWQDDVPVSMAACGGTTPNGARINSVYTPPDRRRRGYASACVASLSARLLAEGRRFCFLYTDLANPTSNAIYQQIGYRPICDVDAYALNKAPAPGPEAV
jgi:predicted GNAT family acetyltransferase